MEALHTETRKGLTIEIHQDDDPINPIVEYDTPVKIACFHPRYDLSNTDEFSSLQEVCEHVKETKAVAVQLYLYDHSGITISTSSFSCPWDSGLVGIAFIERRTILKEWGKLRLTKKLRKIARECIEGEIKCFDLYLTGQCYGYVVKDEDGEDLDSCWGFLGEFDLYGEEGYVLDEARGVADYHAQAKLTRHLARVKQWIINRVPLGARQPFAA